MKSPPFQTLAETKKDLQKYNRIFNFLFFSFVLYNQHA